jgi:hypothetical protein
MSECPSHPLSSIYFKYLKRELDIYLSLDLLISLQNEKDNKKHIYRDDVVVVFEWVNNKIKEIQKSAGFFDGIENELLFKLETFFSIMKDRFGFLVAFPQQLDTNSLFLDVERKMHAAKKQAAEEGDILCRLMPHNGINSNWPGLPHRVRNNVVIRVDAMRLTEK